MKRDIDVRSERIDIYRYHRGTGEGRYFCCQLVMGDVDVYCWSAEPIMVQLHDPEENGPMGRQDG